MELFAALTVLGFTRPLQRALAAKRAVCEELDVEGSRDCDAGQTEVQEKDLDTAVQCCEPTIKMGSVGFRFCTENVGLFSVLFDLKPKQKKRTEHFSVSFSVGFSAKPTKSSTCRRVGVYLLA